MAVMDSTLTGRQLEAHIFDKSANLLQQIVDTWGSRGHEARLKDAVTRTQLLWSVFQAALTDPENPLADNIKSSVLHLSMFIDRRLYATLADPTPDKLESIIDVHRQLAAGLRGSGP